METGTPLHDGHGVDVSVVIPVYNPGKYLRACTDSLLRQSLPPDRFEAIFVDDGSTDGSGAALDELSQQHHHLVVIHQENSGWPGLPRNRGIDAARGRYVFFMDSDDTLADEALERMVAMADEDAADVVVPKLIGQGRRVPRELFRKDVHGATVATVPVMNSLKPQKLFRTAFLNAHGLRFPEGRRRLEDQVFVVAAYLLAESISVLASYPCYYLQKRDDGGNISSEAIDPVTYYRDLRDVLDVIERHTEPGAFRDDLLRRPYRSEMLRRLQGAPLLRYDPATREALLAEVRRLALERFGPGVVARLPASYRLTDDLVRADDLAALMAQARYEQSLRARAEISSVAWAGSTLELTVEGGLQDGRAWLRFPVWDGRAQLPVAPEVGPGQGPEARDVEQDLAKASVQLLLRHRGRGTEFFVPVKTTRNRAAAGDGSLTVTLDSAAAVTPGSAASGRPLDDGEWELVARVAVLGLTKEARVLAPPGTRGLEKAGRERVVRGERTLGVRAYVMDEKGQFGLRVEGRGPGPFDGVARVRGQIREMAPTGLRRGYRKLRAGLPGRSG